MYTADPSNAIGIIPGTISLYHSECLGFFDALSWLYERPVLVLRGIRAALLLSRMQIMQRPLLRRWRAESVTDRAWAARVPSAASLSCEWSGGP